MKRVFCLLCVCLLCLSSASVGALAVEDGGIPDVSPGETSSPSAPEGPLQVELTIVPTSDSGDIVPYVSGEEVVVTAEMIQAVLGLLEEIAGNTGDDNLSVPAVPYDSKSIIFTPAGERSGLAGVISSVFGDYSPATYSVTTYVTGAEVAHGMEIVPGLAGVDWAWIGGLALFSIMLYCFFKLLGGLWFK